MSLTNQIKTALLHYYGFKRGMYCCTELSYYYGNADVFCIPKLKQQTIPSELIEVEVKISKSDLLNEFKSDNFTKNSKYLAFESDIVFDNIPNKFYICVPEDLVEYCKEQLESHNRDYVGILQYKPYWAKDRDGVWLKLNDCISVVKKAKKFRKTITPETYNYFLYAMLNRLRNDNLGLYKEKHFNTNRYQFIRREVLNEINT